MSKGMSAPTSGYAYCEHCGTLIDEDARHLCLAGVLAVTTIDDTDAPCASTIQWNYEMTHGLDDALAWFEDECEFADPGLADIAMQILRRYRQSPEYGWAVREFEETPS